jgi:hypothetical protein
MNTREDVLARLDALVDLNEDLTSRWGNVRDVKKYLRSFSDATLISLDTVTRNEHLSGVVTYRIIALLSSGQRKGLERVVRNIILFAEVEDHYCKLMSVPASNPWKTFGAVEAYARNRVCGKGSVMETPAQAQQMLGVFHGFFALVRHFLTSNDMSRCDYYVTQMVLHGSSREEPHFDGIIEVFQKNSDDAQRLYDFVSSRGYVDPKLLEAVVFFGDDELPSSLYSGVL